MLKWVSAVGAVCFFAVILSGWRPFHHDRGHRDDPTYAGSHYDVTAHHDAPPGGWMDYFEVPLTSNGVTAASDLPSSIPLPAIAWFAWDSGTNNGTVSGTFNTAGAPSSVDAPFCPDADWSDISDSGDPASTSCVPAKIFDGTSDYYELTGGTWDGDSNNTDISICAIHRPFEVAAAENAIAGNRDDGDGDGWYLGYHGTLGTAIYVESDTPATAVVRHAGIYSGAWSVSCGTIDEDSNNYAYMNTAASGAVGHPAGTVASDDAFRVGAAGTSRYEGDIVAVYVWQSELTSAQIATFTRHWMGLLPTPGLAVTAEPTSHVTSGNTCCWSDSTTQELECFAAGWPPIGCVVPPNVTGAGSYGGMLSAIATTNQLLNSRDPNASWAEAGTLIGASSSANSPFRAASYYPVWLLEDDDAGVAEYLTQGVNMTALNTGSDVVLVVYARSGSGTKGFDVRISEETGCAGNLHDFDAVELTTTWKQYEFGFDVADGTCTAMVAYVGPTSGAHPADFATAAETGDAYAIFQLIFNTKLAPPIYVETGSGATATGGGSELIWTNNVGSLLAGASDVEEIWVDYTAARTSVQAPGHQFIYVHVGLTSTVVASQNTLNWYDTGSTNYMSIAAPAYTTPGTTVTFRADLDWGQDTYELFEDGVSKDTSANADAPAAGANDLGIGSNASGTAHSYGGFVQNFKVRRK